MITNEERKEIAANLRNFEWDSVGSYSELCEKLDEIISVPYLYQTTQERLADLIEPEPEETCTWEWRRFGYEESSKDDYEAWNCSNCGEVPGEYGGDGTIEEIPPYCPNCGKKVQS